MMTTPPQNQTKKQQLIKGESKIPSEPFINFMLLLDSLAISPKTKEIHDTLQQLVSKKQQTEKQFPFNEDLVLAQVGQATRKGHTNPGIDAKVKELSYKLHQEIDLFYKMACEISIKNEPSLSTYYSKILQTTYLKVDKMIRIIGYPNVNTQKYLSKYIDIILKYLELRDIKSFTKARALLLATTIYSALSKAREVGSETKIIGNIESSIKSAIYNLLEKDDILGIWNSFLKPFLHFYKDVGLSLIISPCETLIQNNPKRMRQLMVKFVQTSLKTDYCHETIPATGGLIELLSQIAIKSDSFIEPAVSSSLIGLLRLYLSEFEEAEKLFFEAIKKYPTTLIEYLQCFPQQNLSNDQKTMYHSTLGFIYHNSGNRACAIKHFRVAYHACLCSTNDYAQKKQPLLIALLKYYNVNNLPENKPATPHAHKPTRTASTSGPRDKRDKQSDRKHPAIIDAVKQITRDFSLYESMLQPTADGCQLNFDDIYCYDGQELFQEDQKIMITAIIESLQQCGFAVTKHENYITTTGEPKLKKGQINKAQKMIQEKSKGTLTRKISQLTDHIESLDIKTQELDSQITTYHEHYQALQNDIIRLQTITDIQSELSSETTPNMISIQSDLNILHESISKLLHEHEGHKNLADEIGSNKAKIDGIEKYQPVKDSAESLKSQLETHENLIRQAHNGSNQIRKSLHNYIKNQHEIFISKHDELETKKATLAERMQADYIRINKDTNNLIDLLKNLSKKAPSSDSEEVKTTTDKARKIIATILNKLRLWEPSNLMPKKELYKRKPYNQAIDADDLQKMTIAISSLERLINSYKKNENLIANAENQYQQNLDALTDDISALIDLLYTLENHTEKPNTTPCSFFQLPDDNGNREEQPSTTHTANAASQGSP